MALLVRRDEDRSQIQTKVAAELQERLRARPSIENEPVEPAFNENQHTTRYAGIIIVALIVVTIIAILIIVSQRY